MLLNLLENRQQKAAQGIWKLNLAGPPYPSISSLLDPEKGVYSHPVSKLFTDIQRTFLDMTSLPEQVAMLYLVFLLLRWQTYSTPENYDRLPDWLTPRPCQLLTPRILPGWIISLGSGCGSVLSCRTFQFEDRLYHVQTSSINWPYEATSCLLSVSDSDDLLINPVFERHMCNIGNWSLGSCFS